MQSSSPIGILMTDSAFERIHGDIGNPSTWDFPVFYHVLQGTKPADMISLEQANPLVQILAAADALIEQGACGITTTCGFLGLYQQELSQHCTRPVATSALLQVPVVEQLLPAGKRTGILTFNAAALTNNHLTAVGVATDTPIQGMPESSLFYRWIMQGLPDTDLVIMQSEILEAVSELLRRHPDVGAIVAECTNLTPFSAAIARSFNLPVFDAVTLVNWFQQALQPTQFSPDR